MHDSGLVFEKLALNKGDTLLDLGCGGGDYSTCAGNIVGHSGTVYALDIRPDLLDKVCEKAAAEGLGNIHPVVSDIRQQIDIPDKCIDVCLISTVLHIMDSTFEKAKLFTEIKRVLKPNGRLSVIECKKICSQFGPPMHKRISPQELEKELKDFRFIQTDYVDLGTNYMSLFVLKP
jgi:ubiquinone/menaquinone biosynthesis C-methylase UbiE